MELVRYGRPVPTIFDLLGRGEDDMTYALGFVASRSHQFAAALVRAIGGELQDDAGTVRLQTSDDDGRTDVEFEVGKSLFIVFEAKRDAVLPSDEQLKKYVPRLLSRNAAFRRLVAVTNAPSPFARATLPKALSGIPVSHLSWREINQLAGESRAAESHQNKRLLEEFGTYLSEILGMEMSRSNMVYVVSLGDGGCWGLDFKEVVISKRRYFYPVGKNWPAPPNYLGFRCYGQLQSIHHVEQVDVFTNPSQVFTSAEDVTIDPHYIFSLGPPIVPSTPVKLGDSIVRANRVWCMIDTLLTCATITDAVKETKRRLEE